MNIRAQKKLKFLLIILPLFIAFHSCQITSQGPSQYVIESESIQLEWDPPSLEDRNSAPVISYKIYYTIHGMDNWLLLDTIEADEKPS